MATMQLIYDGEKHDDCPFCGEPWASQSHYDLQSCNCLHQTDDADAYTVLIAVADCARRWVPDARIIGNVRAGDILKACNEATNIIKGEAFEMSKVANEYLARAIDAERGRVDPVWSGDDISELPPTIPMPQSRAHAEMMLLVAERYLSANPVGSAASDAEEQ